MALNTAGDYIRLARINLNDGDATAYRYADTTMFDGLQQGIDDMRRLRPDLFFADPEGLKTNIADATTDIQTVDRQYRSALLDYLVAYCENTDDEGADKARSATFRALFAGKLTGMQV